MNKENLLKMADYLEDLEPWEFNMSTYTRGGDYISRNIDHLCGSVGCVIGHAPRVFGVEEEDYEGSAYSEYSVFDWVLYSRRVFGVFGNLWDWCFSGDWGDIDNTPKGAALRIRYLVENGLPEDYYEQITMNSAYMFKDQIGDSNEH